MGVYCYVGLVLILPLNAILFYFLCYQISCILPVNAVKTKNLCSALCCARLVNAVMPGGLFNNAKPLNPLIPLLFNSQLLTARSIHSENKRCQDAAFFSAGARDQHVPHANSYIPHWHSPFGNGHIFPTGIGHLGMAIYSSLGGAIYE